MSHELAIRIAQLPGDSWRCFLEAARGLEYAFNAIGHTCTLDLERKLDINSRRLIIFNAFSLPETLSVPFDAIIYNAEQVQFNDHWKYSTYLRLLSKHIVWDYSKTNIERLSKYGIQAQHCPIGYWPGLSDIPAANEDIDVLFIGSINERRQKVIEACKRQGLKTQVLFGAYGADRNAWIARAKVVLNMHYYPDPIWEVFRVSHLLANKKCVVSEAGGQDSALEYMASQTTALVAYEKLAETCFDLVHNPMQRKSIAETGYEVFFQLKQEDLLRKLL